MSKTLARYRQNCWRNWKLKSSERQNKKPNNRCHSVFYGGLKEALLELSIKEFLNEIKDIDFNLIIYQIDQFYV